MKLSEEQLNKIYDDLHNGICYCGIRNNRGVGRIVYSPYIEMTLVQNYGSTYVPNDKQKLKACIEIFFSDEEDIVPAVYSEYHVNYIPEDSRYEAVDFSDCHPNVYGK